LKTPASLSTQKKKSNSLTLGKSSTNSIKLKYQKRNSPRFRSTRTTGIIFLTENEPALLEDIRNLLEEVAPKNGSYNHPSNAYAHLRSVLMPPDKTLPLINGHVEFGIWQSLMFVETDVSPRKRTVIIQVMGEE
jgi:secondary thiamine-phosphate synthase enzyme